MNHWRKTSEKTILPLSRAKLFSDALKEWFFTGEVFDYDHHEEINCELCNHPELNQHFKIENRCTSKTLLVGSSCILKFNDIEIIGFDKIAVTDPTERKNYLESVLKEKLLNNTLSPIRELWRIDKDNRSDIEYFGNKIKSAKSLSPKDLLSLFERLESYNIQYNPSRYKVSLRSYYDRYELNNLDCNELLKIKSSFSLQQLKNNENIFKNI